MFISVRQRLQTKLVFSNHQCNIVLISNTTPAGLVRKVRKWRCFPRHVRQKLLLWFIRHHSTYVVSCILPSTVMFLAQMSLILRDPTDSQSALVLTTFYGYGDGNYSCLRIGSHWICLFNINSLALRRCGCNLQLGIFKLLSIRHISCKIAHRWMPQFFIDY